ncbi:MAG: invasin domain 3-containing protein [bacterium]|nr:invasin domain 3-containing protein [bacterium]
MSGLLRRCWLAGLVLLLSSLLPPSSARARELLRERFERIRPDISRDNTVVGKDGTRKGYSRTEMQFNLDNGATVSLDFPVAFDNSTRGAISFDLQRKTGTVPRDHRTVFELLDALGRQVLLFQVRWSSEFDPGLPMVYLQGRDYWKNGVGLWSPRILLDREVQPGQWIHVDFAWDDAAKRYLLYVDGRPQDIAPKWYEAKRHAMSPDPRIDINKVMGRGKTPPPFVFRPFQYFLSRVRTFRIGVNSHARRPYIASSPLSTAVLDNFLVLTDEWPRGLADVPRIASVSDDSFRVPGISGKLVAGDRINVTLVGPPRGRASFDVGNANGIPMEEVPASAVGPALPAVDNGTYRGSYVVRPGEYFENGRVIGHFVSVDNVSADPLASVSTWTIDARSRFALSIDKPDLPADSRSTARVKVKTTDANAKPLSGHIIKVTLSTTDEYTGLVGGGAAYSRDAAYAAREALGGAGVETRWKGITDSWGEVEFDFKSGFAAKTILLQAKDMASGDVGVDYITSFKEASIDIALTAPISRAAARRGLLYTIKVEATRTELTADGRSRSVIRATVSDPTGKPVVGDTVVFALSSANGTLNVIKGTTDTAGVATAEYIAGKKIGIVVVTATDTVRNISGSISITLLADAPAKILLKARPETMPADGNSRADIGVKVTDINDNPNKDTKVEFRLSRGSGRMDYPDRITDRFGDTLNRFIAGSTPGIATIVATVRSKIPTDAELAKARNVLFVPYSDAGEDIRISQWLKRKGDTAMKGEPVVEYTFGRGDTKYTLNAPYDCRIDFQCLEYWDTAQTGDTLALLTPMILPGSKTVPPALPAQAPRRR